LVKQRGYQRCTAVTKTRKSKLESRNSETGYPIKLSDRKGEKKERRKEQNRRRKERENRDSASKS